MFSSGFNPSIGATSMARPTLPAMLHLQGAQTLLDRFHGHATSALEIAEGGDDGLAAAQLHQAAVQPQRAPLEEAAQPVFDLLGAAFARRAEGLKLIRVEFVHERARSRTGLFPRANVSNRIIASLASSSLD
jgi:hypothetical protein